MRLYNYKTPHAVMTILIKTVLIVSSAPELIKTVLIHVQELEVLNLHHVCNIYKYIYIYIYIC